jgi:beta-barrel assembly-enhancing protease
MPAAFEGKLFDGLSAQSRTVPVVRLARSIDVGGDTIAFDRLRRDNHAKSLILHHVERPDWRLILPAEAADEFAMLGKLHAVTGKHWAMIGGSIAAIAIIGGAIWTFGGALLGWAAPLVPRSVTEPVGRQYADFFIGKGECRSPQGDAALKAMVARITPREGFVEPVRVRVANNAMINAITLPGGEVLMFDGLIQAAQSPEEVAGVLAHEFGHVQHYHPNRSLIRHFGVSVFLEGLGGNLGGLASTGLFLANSRDAEREADAEAIALMKQGAVSPLGISAFFTRMGGGDPEKAEAKAARGERSRFDLQNLIATHPGDEDRRELFANAAKGFASRPALTDAQWRALKTMCKGDKPDRAR